MTEQADEYIALRRYATALTDLAECFGELTSKLELASASLASFIDAAEDVDALEDE